MANATRPPGNAVDIAGQRFGRLTVLSRDGSTKCGNAKWKCQCDCGNVVSVNGAALRNGRTKSCGCLSRDSQNPRNTKHGKSHTHLYSSWRSMKERCNNPNFKKYNLYGGRGIRVCDEWQTFEGFERWALANGYREDAPRNERTLDRKDPDGNYEPSNCRWVSYAVQNQNKRTNRNITFNGETKTAAEWGRAIGGDRHSILKRLELGWSVERAITEPLRRTNKHG